MTYRKHKPFKVNYLEFAEIKNLRFNQLDTVLL